MEKEMQLKLVVKADEAMATIGNVKRSLDEVSGVKLDALVESFNRINAVVKSAGYMTEQMNKITRTVSGDMAKNMTDAANTAAKAMQGVEKVFSQVVNKNEHDMGMLLALQQKLARESSILGKTLEQQKLFDADKADKEMARLKSVYATGLSKIRNELDKFYDQDIFKKNKKGEILKDKDGLEIFDFSKFFNNKDIADAVKKTADAGLQIAELHRQMGDNVKALKQVKEVHKALNENMVLPVPYGKKKPSSDYAQNMDDYNDSLLKPLHDAIVKRESEITTTKNLTKKELEELAKKETGAFQELYAQAEMALKGEIAGGVKKLLGLGDKDKLSEAEEQVVKDLTDKFTKRQILGQKLRQIPEKLSKEQATEYRRIAENMRNSTVDLAQYMFDNGFHQNGLTILDVGMKDLESVKSKLENKEKLLNELRSYDKRLRDRLIEINNEAYEQSKNQQNEENKQKSKDKNASKDNKNKEEETKKPLEIVSEFGKKVSEMKLETLDLSKEFGKVGEAIPISKAEELLASIEKSKKALIQTMNAMVKATQDPNPTKEAQKPKKAKKQTKVEENPQLKETSKALEQAKDNWDKIDKAIPAPAIGEAAANAKMLETSLLAVTTLDYSKVTGAMEAIGKSSKALIKAAANESKSKAEKEQESKSKEKTAEAKNLIQQRAELIADLERRFTARPNTAMETKAWKKDIDKLGTLTQKIIDMRLELGQVNAVTGDFKQALALATNPKVIDTLREKMGLFYATLERVNEELRIAKANTPMAVESRTNKAFNAADKADAQQAKNDAKEIASAWSDVESKKAKATKSDKKQYDDGLKDARAFFEEEEAKEKRVITAEQNKAKARKEAEQKAISEANAAYDALDKKKAEENAMWRKYNADKVKGEEEVAKATEKEIALYNALRDAEDRHNIKLIDAEQTKSVKEIISLMKQYISLKDKLDDTIAVGKEMNKGQYRRNARKEKNVIRGLADKGVEVVPNYGSYRDYAKPIQEAREAEQLVLNIKKQEVAETQKHLQQLANTAQKLLDIKAILDSYKGSSALALPIKDLEKYRREARKLADELFALSSRKGAGVDQRETVNSWFNGIKTVEPVKKDTQDLKNLISEATVRAEQLYREFEKTGNAADKVRFKQALADLEILTEKQNKMNRALGRGVSVGEKFINILKVRSGWIIGGMTAGLSLSLPSELANAYRAMEQEMAGVQQVLPLIEGNQREVNAEALRFIGIAQEYARGVNEVVEAGRLWGRGYGKLYNDDDIAKTLAAHNAQSDSIVNLSNKEKDYVRDAQAMATTNELVRQSAMLATVDNFSMAESVRGLESVLSAYNMRAKSAEEATAFAGRAVDIITKVSHTGQISAQDLVQGIEATGKAAQQAGISLSFLSAMIETGARNTGKSGSEIGQAIKALTVGAHSKKGIQELQKFGISITKLGQDGKKHLRPLQEVILDISDAIQKGDKNTENMIMAIAGGRYQYSKLYSILSDREEIMRQWGEAINSNGFASKQLEVQMNTINSKIKQIKASLEELIQKAMNSGAGSVLKNLLDLLNTGIKNLASNMKLVQGAMMGTGVIILTRYLGKAIRQFGELRSAHISYRKELNKIDPNASKGLLVDTVKQGISDVAGFVTGKKKEKTASEGLKTALEAEERATEELNKKKKAEIITGNIVVTGQKAQKAASEGTAVAKGVETSMHNANTAAMLREAAVTTVATMGLNLLVGAALTIGAAYVTLHDGTEKQNEALKEATGLSEKDVAAKNDQITALQQEISTRKEQVDYADKAVDSARKLQTSIENGTVKEKEATKAKEELGLIEKNLTTIFGQSAVERIKQAGWTSEAYKKERDNYVKATTDKEKKLSELNRGLHEFYSKKVDLLNNEKEQYEKSISNFGKWTWDQLEGLGILERAWAMYYQGLYNQEINVADNREKQMEQMRDQMHKALARGDSNEYDRIKKEYDVVSEQNKAGLERAASYKDSALNGGLAGFISGIKGKYGEGMSKLSEAYGKLMSFDKPPEASELFDITAPPGEYEEPTGKKKKGKSGKGNKKSVWGYDDETSRSAALLSEQSGLVNHFKPQDFLVLASYMAGYGGNIAKLAGNTNQNIFGVTQEEFNRYLPGKQRNANSNAYVFGQVLNELNKGDVNTPEKIIDAYLKKRGITGFTGHTVTNQSEYLTNGLGDFKGYDFSKDKKNAIPSELRRSGAMGYNPEFADVLEKEKKIQDGLEAFIRSKGGDSYYADVLMNSSLKYGVDPRLAMAVLGQESAYGTNPGTSSAGAYGPMQLMPETAASLGVDRFNVLQNLDGGVRYLADMLQMFGGNVEKALAAYNAGPGNIGAGTGYAKEVMAKYGEMGHIQDMREIASTLVKANQANASKGAKGIYTTNTELEGEGKYWIREAGINVENLTARAKFMLNNIARWWQEHYNEKLTVTSGWRDPSNPVGQGEHNGDAIDIWGNGMGDPAVKKAFRQYVEGVLKAGVGDEWAHQDYGPAHLHVNANGKSWTNLKYNEGPGYFGGVDPVALSKGVGTKTSTDYIPWTYIQKLGQSDSIYDMPISSKDELMHYWENYNRILETTNKSLELRAQLIGTSFEVESIQLGKLNQQYNDAYRQKNAYNNALSEKQEEYNDILKNNPQLERMANERGTSFKFLTPQEQADAFKKVAGEEAAKIPTELDALIKEADKVNLAFLEVSNKYKKAFGYLNPKELYDFTRQQLEDNLNKNDGKEPTHKERVENARKINELDEAEALRLQQEKNKWADLDAKRRESLLERREKLEEKINTLDEKDTKALEENKRQLADINEELDGLYKHGSAGFMRAEQALKKQQKVAKESKDALRDMEAEVRKAGANMTNDFFDKLITQGKTLRDIFKDIQMEIAKIAMRRAINTMFGVRNKPLSQEGDMGMVLENLGHPHKRKKPVPDLNYATQGAQAFRGNYFPMSWKGAHPQYPNKWDVSNGLNSPLLKVQNAMDKNAQATQKSITAMGSLQASTDAAKVAQDMAKTATTTNTTQTQAAATQVQAATTAHGAQITAHGTQVANNSSQLANNTAAVNRNSTTKSVGGAGGGIGVGVMQGVGIASSIASFFMRDGGKIPAFANGGTTGLIKGAGTDTSDSILTYLANRGRFIMTSNGEYIVNGKATKALGTDMLDLINNHPDKFLEQWKALNGKYANGGALGEEMVPAMKSTTASSFKRYSANKTVIEKNNNRKLEELMAKQNELISDMAKNRGEGNSRLVVLNTQADSASVMKAIQKNPRAIQKVLGRQQSHGFRG